MNHNEMMFFDIFYFIPFKLQDYLLCFSIYIKFSIIYNSLKQSSPRENFALQLKIAIKFFILF